MVIDMDSQYNSYNYTKGKGSFNNAGRPIQKEIFKGKNDEDLIIEENTIYEIDRDCVERLKRSRKR